MTAHEIASRAAEITAGDREAQHGSTAHNFSNIACLWNGYLAIRRDPAEPLTAIDVGHMMVLLKLARTQAGRVNADDWIDMAGYSACSGEVALQPASQPQA